MARNIDYGNLMHRAMRTLIQQVLLQVFAGSLEIVTRLVVQARARLAWRPQGIGFKLQIL